MAADERPVARWRVMTPEGREVCQLPSRLAPTAADAERILRKNLGDSYHPTWKIVPFIHGRHR